MLKMNKCIKITVLPLLFLILALSSIKSYAQSSLSIGAAPTSKTLKLEAGQTYTDEVVFWNLADKADTYFVYVRGFKQIENQPGTAIILTEQEDADAVYSASKWVSVDKSEVLLEPNKNIKVKYTINVPKDVTDGEYNAQIFLVSKLKVEGSGTRAFTSLASGMPILITIGDEFVENAELLRFNTDLKTYEKVNVTFLTKIKNLGDTHITPSGEIIVKNIFKQEVARIRFNPNRQSLLRDNIGNYEDNWSSQSYLSPDKKLLIGPMTAEIVATYRSLNPGFSTLNSQVTFWIVPWKWIIAILAVILVSTFILIRKNKDRR